MAENWSDLLSLNTPLVLTGELRRQIVDVLARFPWWSLDKVTSHLQIAAAELDLAPAPPPKGVPSAQKLKWILFAGPRLRGETASEDDALCCTYCGSDQVRRKSKQPRSKRYRDEDGQWQSVAVYRYYCDNADCPYGSFTHFPLGLLPHSPYPLQMRLTAVQLYAWAGSTYRRTAVALGIKSGQAYQWVTAFGQALLPVAALFGVVRSSGVVGVDEKWVQIPDKAKRGQGSSPRGTAKRWMYVYLAVDVYTYDLLHIAVYAHNTKAAARTFLLALKAKGYRPRVIVTDLRIDYGAVIASTFPQATHHECIFHALQWWSQQFKLVYGHDYAQTHPLAVQLKKDIQHIFQAKTKRTAQKRYEQVVAWRAHYVQQTPDAAVIFDSLDRHWPKLVNSIESRIIPSTNNATEMVIGRFDQLYQNLALSEAEGFCGFDSIESARIFLAVFEKVYRFTPFSDDAQPRIRGQSPLELAGYDISQLAMSQLCRGWALNLPLLQ